jgi:hypothetical protein
MATKEKLYYDSDTAKTFKEAFAEARKDGSKTFEWNGEKYNTKLKEKVPETEAKSSPSIKEETSSKPEKEEKKYGIGPHGAFGEVEKFIEKNFKTPAQRRDEEKASSKMAKGGSVSSASKRADGIAIRGKTRA